MIVLLVPEDEADVKARETDQRRSRVLDLFAERIHGFVPINHATDLHERDRIARRGICGEVDCGYDSTGRDTGGRVVPTRQGLCPHCGGKLHDAEEIEVRRSFALRHGLGSASPEFIREAAKELVRKPLRVAVG